jgi:hypothetical protein
MRRLRRLHRLVGVTAALFTLWLAVSGILLQHAPGLGLHERFVTHPAILAWYGVGIEDDVHGYRAGTHVVVQLDERIFVGRHRLALEDAALRGAIADGNDLIVALADGVLRVDAAGRILDRAGELEGVPTSIERIGRAADGQIVIAAAGGLSSLSPDFLEVAAYPASTGPATEAPDAAGARVQWSVHGALPTPDDATAAAYLDGVISIERLLADLHTGRLGGDIGPWLVDASAVALIVLALSGLWLFARTR